MLLRRDHGYPSVNSCAIILMWLGFNLLTSVSTASAQTETTDQSDSTVSLVVFLDSDQSARQMPLPTDMARAERIRTVTSRLKQAVPSGNLSLERFLKTYSTTPIIRHWITPAVTVSIPAYLVDSLSGLPGVKRVVYNVALTYDPPVEISQAPSDATNVSEELVQLAVPSLWSRGLTGAGRLVCSFDTGVEYSHPALASKWRGNHASLNATWYSKVTPWSPPSDKIGHGTHTMGVMVGSDGDNAFGVAPGAEWITAGVVDQGRALSLTLSDIMEAFQWALNPDGDDATTDDVPDVILNSWGLPKGLFAPCDDMFADVIQNVEAAGIVTIFSAGNEGPEPKTLRSPGDQAITPLNTFSVGAVDINLAIAEFSSRGPSSCDQNQIKPEVVAPGVSIRSSYKGGGYAFMTGTSMAAPYIAGSVALIRQYNPDATVDEIKSALIQCATDLGAPGEDNSYGYGIPDLSRVLDYISMPESPEVSVASVNILGAGTAAAGESFQLRLSLTNASSTSLSVTGRIWSTDNYATVEVGEMVFDFISGAPTTFNTVPFELSFDTGLFHGTLANFEIELSYLSGPAFDTLTFDVVVGVSPVGAIAHHDNGALKFSVSDFGQFGFAPGSIYNVNGYGLQYNGSGNMLYEAGLVVGRNPLLLSSAARDSSGTFVSSDFVPVEVLSTGYFDADGGYHLQSGLSDKESSIPIPVSIQQESITWDTPGDAGFVLVRYRLINDSIERLSNINMGLIVDLDLPGTTNRLVLDPTANLIYQKGDGDLIVGLLGLKNVAAFGSHENTLYKSGFTRVQLYDMISSENHDVDEVAVGDMMFMASSIPFTLNPAETGEVVFAFVVGTNLVEFYENVDRVKNKFGMSTGISTIEGSLPDGFQLAQNYPNPFNPSTTISFALPDREEVTLEVLNILGRHVSTLYSGMLPAGVHEVAWPGTDGSGNKVSSGVYFYRLRSDSHSETKKMTLLK